MSSAITSPVGPAPRVRRRSRRPLIVALIVVIAMSFLIGKGLDNATMYFRTADEAVAQRNALEGKRFRLEGTVVPGSIKPNGAYVDFVVAGRSATVAVRNEGQPVGIFQENIPVVLEGKFAPGSDTFNSDRILVKHSEDYQAKHPDRVTGSAPADSQTQK